MKGVTNISQKKLTKDDSVISQSNILSFLQKENEISQDIKKRNNSTPNKNIIPNQFDNTTKNSDDIITEIIRCFSYQTLLKIDGPSSKSPSTEKLYSPPSVPEITPKNEIGEMEKYGEMFKGENDLDGFEECFGDIESSFKNVFIDSRKLQEDSSSNDNIINDSSSNSITRVPTKEQMDYELNFYRSGGGIRESYITKLISKNILNPITKPKTHNSIIIFDWDDTLLPTTFLTPGGVYNENVVLSEQVQKKFAKLESSVSKLLKASVEKGDVYIITNAGKGWVEFSAKKYYPSVYDILQKIKIISARNEFEKQFPGDSRKWKIQTFLSLSKKLDVKLVTNIICLGDSSFEMEAGRVLAAQFKQAFIKTVKFREGPKPDELNKQLTLVLAQFNSIYSSIKNLTIRVEKKKSKEEV